MSDDESPRVAPREHAGGDRYGEALLYDFAKFLTTTSLIMLGGMLTLSGAVRAGDLELLTVAVPSGAIAFAGLLAFAAAGDLTRARAQRKDSSRHLVTYVRTAVFLMGLAIPGFLLLWMESLR